MVAISYYALSLVSHIFAPVAEHFHVSEPVLLALLTVPVIVVVWYLVRRIRKKLGHGSEAP